VQTSTPTPSEFYLANSPQNTTVKGGALEPLVRDQTTSTFEDNMVLTGDIHISVASIREHELLERERAKLQKRHLTPTSVRLKKHTSPNAQASIADSEEVRVFERMCRINFIE